LSKYYSKINKYYIYQIDIEIY